MRSAFLISLLYDRFGIPTTDDDQRGTDSVTAGCKLTVSITYRCRGVRHPGPTNRPEGSHRCPRHSMASGVATILNKQVQMLFAVRNFWFCEESEFLVFCRDILHPSASGWDRLAFQSRNQVASISFPHADFETLQQ